MHVCLYVCLYVLVSLLQVYYEANIIPNISFPVSYSVYVRTSIYKYNRFKACLKEHTGHKFHCLGYKKHANPGGSLSNCPNFSPVMLPQCSLE